MANRNWASGGKVYSMHVSPVLLDCNFVVDSTNSNGLGIRSLKGPAIANVYMHTSATPAAGNPNPSSSGGPPVGSPALGASSTFAILGATAVSNTGSSVLTGDLGISPNNSSSVTGFPPGTFSGTEHAADATAALAQVNALAAYTDLSTRSSSVISSTLDGQTLTAGVYRFASGSASLAAAGNGTLTFSGSATDIFVIQTSTTLTTGAGGIPSMVLTGGALASNVYWAIGSSATLNVSGSGNFVGTMIANTSITLDGGSAVSRFLALNGAVTISAATTISVPPPQVGSGGVIIVQFNDSYNRALSGFNSIVSPLSGTNVTSIVAGGAYVLTSLGTASLAQLQAAGLPMGMTPAVGAAFVAKITGPIGGSAAVQLASISGSGITDIETIGDPNATIDNTNYQTGAQVILQCFKNGVQTSPADGTVISLSFLLSNSSISVQGE